MFDVQDEKFNTKFVQNKEEMKEMFDVQDQKFEAKFDQNRRELKEEIKEMFDAQGQKLEQKLEQQLEQKLEQKLDLKFGVMKKELETKIDSKFEEAQNFMGVLVEDLEDEIKIVTEMVVQNSDDIAVIKNDIGEIKEALKGKVDRSECLFLRKACAR